MKLLVIFQKNLNLISLSEKLMHINLKEYRTLLGFEPRALDHEPNELPLFYKIDFLFFK